VKVGYVFFTFKYYSFKANYSPDVNSRGHTKNTPSQTSTPGGIFYSYKHSFKLFKEVNVCFESFYGIHLLLAIPFCSAAK